MEDGIQDRIDGYAEYIGAMSKEKYSIRVCSIIDAMKINSPIEQLYVATLLYAQALGNADGTIKVFPQFKVGKYRADFCLIDTKKSKNGYEQTYQILVELDSYQFHNRNPKQHTYEKKREREIQKSGYQVIRFSGSEVISDPEKCVMETLEVLYKICAVAVF